MNVTGTVKGGDKLIESTNAFSSKMMARLRKEVAVIAVEMVAKVKGDKLTGQVLKVQTGRLRRSITFKLNNGPNTATATVGTNVEYARVHEFGFTGPVSVRAHLRQMASGEQVQVPAHTRNVKLPERSFLRSTLAEMKGSITERLQKAASGS